LPAARAETPGATAGSKQKRPGGRTERNRQRVAAAVLQLIGEGRLDFGLQEVAVLAGVHRTTLFRRWPDRSALIAEALAEHVSHLSIAFCGDWQEDLRRIAFGMRDFLDDPVEIAMNRLLVASDNEDFREQMFRHWAPVIETLHLPLAAARAAGEISPHIEPATLIGMLISPIIVSTVLMGVTPGDAFLRQLIEQTILACGGARIEGGISRSVSAMEP